MYDTMTRAELSEHHEALYHVNQAVFYRMFGHDFKPIIEIGGERWNLLAAKHDEISEAMAACYAEIQRRDREAKTNA